VKEEKQEQEPLFPKDLFTPQQNRQGAVICHIVGKYQGQLFPKGFVSRREYNV